MSHFELLDPQVSGIVLQTVPCNYSEDSKTHTGSLRTNTTERSGRQGIRLWEDIPQRFGEIGEILAENQVKPNLKKRVKNIVLSLF